MFETVDLGAAKEVVKKLRLGKDPALPPAPPHKQPAASHPGEALRVHGRCHLHSRYRN